MAVQAANKSAERHVRRLRLGDPLAGGVRLSTQLRRVHHGAHLRRRRVAFANKCTFSAGGGRTQSPRLVRTVSEMSSSARTVASEGAASCRSAMMLSTLRRERARE
jgi:hypothetical protein